MTIRVTINSALRITVFMTPILMLLSLLFPTTVPLIFALPRLVTVIATILLVVIVNGSKRAG